MVANSPMTEGICKPEVDRYLVSPGQACVFYASTEPEARVLGGGTIAATTAARGPAAIEALAG